LGAERSEVEGTGVGLALCRRLVEAMGGTIGLDPDRSLGSCFWVDLPAAPNPLAACGNTTGEREPASDDRALTEVTHRILHIEDNISNVRLVERVLSKRRDIELLSAMQGRIGLALAAELRPELILLDVHLPDMEG